MSYSYSFINVSCIINIKYSSFAWSLQGEYQPAWSWQEELSCFLAHGSSSDYSTPLVTYCHKIKSFFTLWIIIIFLVITGSEILRVPRSRLKNRFGFFLFYFFSLKRSTRVRMSNSHYQMQSCWQWNKNCVQARRSRLKTRHGGVSYDLFPRKPWVNAYPGCQSFSKRRAANKRRGEKTLFLSLRGERKPLRPE